MVRVTLQITDGAWTLLPGSVDLLHELESSSSSSLRSTKAAPVQTQRVDMRSSHGCRGAYRLHSASSVTAKLHVGLRSDLKQVDRGIYELPSLRSIITWQRM